MNTHFVRTIFKAAFGAALVLLTATVASAAGPTWTNGQAALIVLGQPNFSTNTTGTTAATMKVAQGVGVDPTTGKLFVADSSNHRVLRFSSAAARASGSAAEAVLGQADFVSGSANRGGATPGQNTMNNPAVLFVDSNGRLWVSDYINSRVLRFDSASSKANGANADGVLGQADFVHGALNRGGAVAANTLTYPGGLFVDTAGRLWVSDEVNYRVLRFDNAATKANGANADGVLGQADFTHNGSATTQSGMKNPAGVIVNNAGTLFVGEWLNNRVLRFDNAASKANGANADGVLGQADFTHSVAATTQAGFTRPTHVTLDNVGRLYVSDGDNNRVMIFNNAASLANGANADNVLGHPDFTTGTANTGGIFASTLNTPRQVFFDTAANVLWVADRANNRVLRYADPTYYLFLPLILR